jgi:general nucleoside transport system permease protein
MATPLRLGDPRLLIPLRLAGLTALALLAVGGFLLCFGRNPVRAYATIFAGALGSSYGLSEVVVRAIPLMLCAVATAVPARIGLLNVGAEGQLHAGALLTTWGALALGALPRATLLPTLVLLGLAGGAAAALVPAILRLTANVNETISTLLLNYVIVLLVEYAVRGPWKDPMSYNWPFTPEFPAAARLGFYGGTRVHTGLWFALVAVALFYVVLRRTRWGYEIRVLGDNPEAAVRAGINFARYVLLTMCVGGALAGLAGMAEVCAIQGRLRPGISTGFGYTGFLVSWLALHHPLGIVAMALLLGVLSVGGDLVQISLGLPYATVNIIMALIFFVVLGSRYRQPRTA